MKFDSDSEGDQDDVQPGHEVAPTDKDKAEVITTYAVAEGQPRRAQTNFPERLALQLRKHLRVGDGVVCLDQFLREMPQVMNIPESEFRDVKSPVTLFGRALGAEHVGEI